MLNKLQMVNDNYAKGRQNIPLLSEILKVDEDIVKDLYTYTHTKLKSVLESALNSLAKQSWIEWHKKKTVCIKNGIPELNNLGNIKLDERGNAIVNVVIEFREATLEEVQEILKYESLMLDELECKDKREVLIKGQLEYFRNEVNKRLKENCNIEFYYESYEIISHKDTLVKRLKRMERVDTYKELNKRVLDGTYKSIETKHNNSKEKIKDIPKDELTLNDYTDFLRADEEYVCTSKTVTDKIITRKARKIGALWN